MENKKKLTSVKLPLETYEKFKLKCFETGFSFRKLAEAAIIHYIEDIDFREKMHKTKTSR